MAEAVSHIGRPRIQAVDLQEATSEPACAYPHADRPGIRVAEYCLVISWWWFLLWPRGDKQPSKVMLWVTWKDSRPQLLPCRFGLFLTTPFWPEALQTGSCLL